MEFEIMARNKVKNKDNPGNEGKVSLQPKIGNIIHFHCAKKETHLGAR